MFRLQMCKVGMVEWKKAAEVSRGAIGWLCRIFATGKSLSCPIDVGREGIVPSRIQLHE